MGSRTEHLTGLIEDVRRFGGNLRAAVRARRLWTATPMPQLVHSESDLLEFARDAARRFGDPAPTLIEHVVTTRTAATALSGSTVLNDERPVYLVAIRGHFLITSGHPRLSDPQPLPAGVYRTKTRSVLRRVIDIATGKVIDSGSGQTYPDLASVGTVITDYQDSSHGSESGQPDRDG